MDYDILIIWADNTRLEVDVKFSIMGLHADPPRLPRKPNWTRGVRVKFTLKSTEALWRANAPGAAQRVVRVLAWAASQR